MLSMLAPGLVLADRNFTGQVCLAPSFMLQVFYEVAVSLLVRRLILKSYKPLLIISRIERRIDVDLIMLINIAIPDRVVLQR